MKESNNWKKGGRPKLNPKDLRNKVIRIRFTEDEYNTLKKEFKLSNYPFFGAYIYAKVKQHKVNLMMGGYIPDDFRYIFRAVSNNTNQIAMALNAHKNEPLVKQMEEDLRQLSESFTQLVAEIKKPQSIDAEILDNYFRTYFSRHR